MNDEVVEITNLLKQIIDKDYIAQIKRLLLAKVESEKRSP